MADETLTPPDDFTAHPSRSPFAPKADQIGPYHILGLLGAGGMGEVYKAERRSPMQQTVAIKIIKLGFDTREVVARFNSERQALARMDHPNVARVLDAGVADNGRPYFAMEYVAGAPITKFADDNKLSIKERLLLFTQACDAITHAHTKAIIHRDIKPSNVLAYLHDGKPTVKVIDFGIAKALTGDRLTDATFNTEHGGVVGSYDSMSPEQAEGSPDIDTRTDGYSLGVLLYELLAGAKPFDHETLARSSNDEVKRIIREVEPPRPSRRLFNLGEGATKIASLRLEQLEALARELRSELEWIPLKAMRKERDRRYLSAQELAHDVQNYLDGAPLLAAPDSIWYRFKKNAWKRRTPIAVTGVVALGIAIAADRCGFVAVTVFLLVLLAGLVGTTVNMMRARKSQREAVEQRNLAENNRREAEVRRQEAEQQREEARSQASIAEAVTRFQSDMLASANPDKLRGATVTVLEAAQAAVKELDFGKLKDQPMVEAAVREIIGVTLSALGRHNEAEYNLRKSLELRRNHLPGEHPDIATSLNHIAFLLQGQGRLSEAERDYRDALRLRQSAFPRAHPKIAECMNNLAWLLYTDNRIEEAEPLSREALAMRRATLGSDHTDVAWSLNNLASILQAQGRAKEAEPLLQKAVSIVRRILPAGHPDIAPSLSNLAALYNQQGRPMDAERLFREVLEIWRSALPVGHPDIAFGLHNLAWVLFKEGKTAEAESLVREAIRILREKFGVRAKRTVETSVLLVDLLDRESRHEEVAALRRECGLAEQTTRPTAAPPAEL